VAGPGREDVGHAIWRARWFKKYPLDWKVAVLWMLASDVTTASGIMHLDAGHAAEETGVPADRILALWDDMEQQKRLVRDREVGFVWLTHRPEHTANHSNFCQKIAREVACCPSDAMRRAFRQRYRLIGTYPHERLIMASDAAVGRDPLDALAGKKRSAAQVEEPPRRRPKEPGE